MAKQGKMSRSDTLFSCLDVHVEAGGREVVKGVRFEIRPGEKHALMGPNGSGKSSLANALMGHPGYRVTKGRVFLRGEDITEMPPDERARKGLFLGFQYPVAVPGVTVANFLRSAVKARLPKGDAGNGSGGASLKTFRKTLKENLKLLAMDEAFATRYVNDGFSGGEKKRLEILQMAMLRPSVALLDETDSGLDIDALKVVANGINKLCGPDAGVLLVTHYQRILNHVKPDRVHVLIEGRIAESGGPELALKLEEKGYDWVQKQPDGDAEASTS
jgi:Fe-S cluster assembly ATP-binding protein